MVSGKCIRSKTGHTKTAIFFLFLTIILVSTGCLTQDRSTDVMTGSGEFSSAPDNAGPEQTAGIPSVASTAIPIVQKNISITRPNNPGTSFTCTFPSETCSALQALDSPAEGERINGFLRWESVRARTNISEKARLNALIDKIDTIISATYAGEDLTLYAAAGPGTPEQIRSSGIYSEDGYMSGSYDISVVWHEIQTSARGSTGYDTVLVFQEKTGSHILYLNESRRSIIVPRGMKWELAGEEQVEHLVFTPDSMPKFRDDSIEKVQLMYLTRIT